MFAANNPIANVDPLGLPPAPAGSVRDWTFERKPQRVMERAAVQLPDEIGQALRELVSPEAIATTAAIFGVWVGAQLTPFGVAADVAMAGIGYLMLGTGIWEVISGLNEIAVLIHDARCEPDLDRAGDILAKSLGSTAASSAGSATALGTVKTARIVRQVLRGSPPQRRKKGVVTGVREIENPVLGRTRAGSATKTDSLHSFPGMVDNYVRDVTKFSIPTNGPGGVVIRHSELYQGEGVLNGMQGVLNGSSTKVR